MALEKKRVDEDWKRQVEQEKETMAGEAKASDEASSSKSPGVSETSQDFLAVINQLAVQAMIGLGQIDDPRSGARTPDIELARQFINQLGSLEQKTRGHLSTEETRIMQEVLQSLRMGSVELSRAASTPPPEAPTL